MQSEGLSRHRVVVHCPFLQPGLDEGLCNRLKHCAGGRKDGEGQGGVEGGRIIFAGRESGGLGRVEA